MNNHLRFRLMFALALVLCTQSLHGYGQAAPLSLGAPGFLHGAHASQAASGQSTAQQTKVLAPHKPIAPLVPAAKQRPLPPAKPGSMIGGIWMTDADYKSSIYLRNIVETSSITVVPVLWLSNGTSYVLDAVTIDPAGTKVVDINAGLQSKGIAPYATLSGYVELRYNWPWVPLCATIRNVDTAHSLIFTYGLGPSTTPATVAGPSVATVAEGLWWKQEPAVSAFVALSNPAAVSIPATVQVMDDQGSELESHTVAVSPHGTKLLQIASLELNPRTIGGIHITYKAPPGATLLLTGGLEDQSSGYSAAIPFVTLSSAAPKSFNTTITELGLMVGASDPMMNFPAETRFTPYSVVRNVTKAPMTFSPTLWWMEGGAARSFALPALTLMPNQAQQLNVPAYLSAAGLDHFNGNFNLVLNAQGQRGGLLMAAGSVDDKNTYVFEVIPRGVAVSASKSLSYWSTGNGDDTMVTMWNPADEAQDLIFRLFFTGGDYAYPVHLAARATQTLNISELIENQTPDMDGNVIPASVHEGSAKIAGQGADNQQILVAVDAGVYNVKKATCGEECWTCDGANDATLTPSPFTVDVDDGTVQMDFQISWDTGANYNETSYASWSGSSGISVSSSGVVSGQTAGSASVGAEYYGPVYTTICLELPADDPCPIEDDYGASASGTVNDPTPSISGITPSTWEAGASGQSFRITGSNFGTNKPTLNFNPSSGISYTITSNSDSSISGSYSVTSGTPTETVQVSVTSTGFGGNKFQSNGGNSATSGQTSIAVNSGCPTSFGTPINNPESLSSVFAEGYRTGIGSYFSLPALGGGNYNGTPITENMSLTSSTCSSSVKSALANLCAASGGLQIDKSFTSFDGTNHPGQSNIEFDEHGTILMHSVLSAGGTTCQIVCSQTYSCNNKSLGTYNVTFTVSAGTYTGSTVTNISVTETENGGSGSLSPQINERNIENAAQSPRNKFQARGGIESIEEALKKYGIALDPSSLETALHNSNGKVRGLAAMQLIDDGGSKNLYLVEEALSREDDPLTKTNMAIAVASADPIAGEVALSAICKDNRYPDFIILNAARVEIVLPNGGYCSNAVQGIAEKSQDAGTKQGALTLLPQLEKSGADHETLKKILRDSLESKDAGVRLVGATFAIKLFGSEGYEMVQKAEKVERDIVVKNELDELLKYGK